MNTLDPSMAFHRESRENRDGRWATTNLVDHRLWQKRSRRCKGPRPSLQHHQVSFFPSPLEASGIDNQTGGLAPSGSGAPSSRSSLDSGPTKARLSSPSPNARPMPGAAANRTDGPGTVDFVYLKNVLLQFLGQKDKKNQQHLIPVLAMLLHFDQ